MTVWKEIPGFPAYEVSEDGQVRSYYSWAAGRSFVCGEPQKVLKASSGCVALMRDGQRHRFRVSRLLAMAFGEDCPLARAMSVRKLTEAKVVQMREKRAKGTSVAKLAEEYGLSKGYASEVCRGTRWKEAGGPLTIGQYTSKLSNESVREMRELRADGESMAWLADEFGVTVGGVSLIVRGKRRRVAGGPIEEERE